MKKFILTVIVAGVSIGAAVAGPGGGRVATGAGTGAASRAGATTATRASRRTGRTCRATATGACRAAGSRGRTSTRSKLQPEGELPPELREVVQPRVLLPGQEPQPLVVLLLLAEVRLPGLLVPEHLLLLLLVRAVELLLPGQLLQLRPADPGAGPGVGPGDGRGPGPVRRPGPGADADPDPGPGRRRPAGRLPAAAAVRGRPDCKSPTAHAGPAPRSRPGFFVVAGTHFPAVQFRGHAHRHLPRLRPRIPVRRVVPRLRGGLPGAPAATNGSCSRTPTAPCRPRPAPQPGRPRRRRTTSASRTTRSS